MEFSGYPQCQPFPPRMKKGLIKGNLNNHRPLKMALAVLGGPWHWSGPLKCPFHDLSCTFLFFLKLDYFESNTSKPQDSNLLMKRKKQTSQVLGLIGDSRASTKSSFALHPLWYSCWKHWRKPLFPVVRNPLPLLEVSVRKC